MREGSAIVGLSCLVVPWRPRDHVTRTRSDGDDPAPPRIVGLCDGNSHRQKKEKKKEKKMKIQRVGGEKTGSDEDAERIR